MAKFSVGDKVRRDPKVWKPGAYPEKSNRGVVSSVEPKGFKVKFQDGREQIYQGSELVRNDMATMDDCYAKMDSLKAKADALLKAGKN